MSEVSEPNRFALYDAFQTGYIRIVVQCVAYLISVLLFLEFVVYPKNERRADEQVDTEN
jgi:hypothetical protein